MIVSNDDLYQRLLDSKLPEKTFWKVYCSHAMSYDSYHGKIWRAKNKIIDMSHLFQHDIGKPLALTGDWIIIGDVQLPTTDYDFAILPAAIAKRHLKRPRQLLIAGDLVNMDCFSTYANEIGLPGFRQEIQAAKAIVGEWLKFFDRIVYTAGNHERRLSKQANGALLMEDLISIIGSRMETSNFDRVTIDTEQGVYTVPHGSDYSINQLTVADQLAQKYRTHIISWHEHHLAKGFDRYGHNIIVNGGGLFNEWYMSYVQLNTSKKARMKNGFVMLRDGYPYIFGKEPFTNWNDWLGSKIVKAAA